jgi:hypothetical protein
MCKLQSSLKEAVISAVEGVALRRGGSLGLVGGPRRGRGRGLGQEECFGRDKYRLRVASKLGIGSVESRWSTLLKVSRKVGSDDAAGVEVLAGLGANFASICSVRERFTGTAVVTKFALSSVALASSRPVEE